MNAAEKKEYILLVCCLFYFKYKDYSLDQLESFLLSFYQKKDPSCFFEVIFLELLINLRSSY